MLDELKDRIESFKQAAATATGEEIEAAKKVMNEIREWVNSAFDEIDNLIFDSSQKSGLDKYVSDIEVEVPAVNFNSVQQGGYFIKDELEDKKGCVPCEPTADDLTKCNTEADLSFNYTIQAWGKTVAQQVKDGKLVVSISDSKIQISLSDTVFNLEKYLLSKGFIKSELHYVGSQEYGYIKDGIGFIDSQRTTTLAFVDFADNGTAFCIEIDFETIKGQAMAEMLITVLENEVKPKNE